MKLKEINVQKESFSHFVGRYIKEHKELRLSFDWDSYLVYKKGHLSTWHDIFHVANDDIIIIDNNDFLSLAQDITKAYEKEYDGEITIKYKTIVLPNSEK